jgi:hypothetical protein
VVINLEIKEALDGQANLFSLLDLSTLFFKRKYLFFFFPFFCQRFRILYDELFVEYAEKKFFCS